MAKRDENRRQRRIKAARFPVLKELADYDFSCVPSLNKQRVLELARGGYLTKSESIIMVGNPGLGKTHVATGIALAACRQGHRVRFYNAAGLVNELIQAQDNHELPRFMATALRHRLIVLDELGFIPFSSTGAQLIFQFCSTLYERVSMLVTTNLRFADWTQIFGEAHASPQPYWIDSRTKRTFSSSLVNRIASVSACNEKRRRRAMVDGLWTVWTTRNGSDLTTLPIVMPFRVQPLL